ncbi:integral membrane protein [Amycolatopsis methanolica 239]|uniref:Integral membrane protein n=2 Tax=Amycolatopsis methanolica TaxID=1814 RepID=A0A076MY39_AMYME|nr:integral membrane protein [Amycolatopsis methanolica 239]
MRWVNVIVGAIAAGWAVLVAVFLYVGFNADDPGLPVVLFLLVVGVAVGLLMVVMRALLRQATTLRTDMEAVI